MSGYIAGVLMDYDGSCVPQGGRMRGLVLSFLQAIGGGPKPLPIGLATGKPCDFIQGLYSGGLPLGYFCAESGALWAERVGDGANSWRYELAASGEGVMYLKEFAALIGFDVLSQVFRYRGVVTRMRPELKLGILTLFPSAGDPVEYSLGWSSWFQEIISERGYKLKVKRYSDGGIDIIPDGVSKRFGVERACRLLNCEPQNILTVVDGANDHELATGTTAIAVGNAHPDIIEIVRSQGGYVASNQDGYGMAEGMVRYARQGRFKPYTAELILAAAHRYLPPLARSAA